MSDNQHYRDSSRKHFAEIKCSGFFRFFFFFSFFSKTPRKVQREERSKIINKLFAPIHVQLTFISITFYVISMHTCRSCVYPCGFS